MDEQKRTEYAPTLAESKLLEVLLDPANRLKSVTDLCALAEIGRTTYYEAFAKPEFADLVQQKSLELLKRAVPAGMNALLREATRGSFPHLKMLLEMAGMYRETMRQEITGNVHVGVVLLPTVDLEDKVRALAKRLPDKE